MVLETGMLGLHLQALKEVTNTSWPARQRHTTPCDLDLTCRFLRSPTLMQYRYWPYGMPEFISSISTRTFHAPRIDKEGGVGSELVLLSGA
jgi:hypothetical protein